MRSSIGPEEGRAHALPCRDGLGPQGGQVPVGLLGVEAVHLEQQAEGPVGAGADQEGRGRQELEQLPEPVAGHVGWPPQGGAVAVVGGVDVPVGKVLRGGAGR